jgi:glycosyltransferase involved in cell wall biosynthesis
MQNHNPLITIVVVTYNSAEFVLETLESAREQTWQNLELIITDDCSTDNTVEICRNWLENNKNRFVKADLITSEINTGIAPNANRGLKVAKGEWIKFLAGDDMLLPNCIDELVNYILNNADLPIKFLVHGIIPFRNGNVFKVVYPPEELMQSDAKKQLIYLLKRGNSIAGCAFFLERSTLMNLGGYDEKYSLFEDYPLLLKYTQNNYKIWLIKKPVFKYRIHSSNLSFDRSFLLKDSFVRFKKDILFPLLLEQGLYLTYWHRFLQGRQKYRIFWSFLSALSPVAWKNKMYKFFGKNYFYNHKVEFQKKVCKH